MERLIRDSKLDRVWRIDNDEAAEFYPVSHTKACRCHNRSRKRMEQAGDCLRRCQETARQFEDWKRRQGPKPRPIDCAYLESAEGRIVKVTLGPTKPPHGVGARTRLPPGLTHAQGPVHYICIGMFKHGVFTPQQAELTLRKLDNHLTLQGNWYQLGIYGFGTHNAKALVSQTIPGDRLQGYDKKRTNCLSMAVSTAARLQ